MSKARDLADIVAAGSPLVDGTIETTDITNVTASATELNYTDGVTSNIQTQMDTKVETLSDLSITATATELNYVDGVTSAIQTQIDTKAPTASPTFTGKVAVDGTLDIEEVYEKVTTSTTTSGTLTLDTVVQGVYYVTSNQTANRTIDFTNVNSNLAIGQSVTCSVLLTQGSTAYYLNAYQVDSSAVTPKWSGGSAPTEGNASGIDVYTFTIIKTADATFTVLASQTQYA